MLNHGYDERPDLVGALGCLKWSVGRLKGRPTKTTTETSSCHILDVRGTR
jgi:hypothetical protein